MNIDRVVSWAGLGAVLVFVMAIVGPSVLYTVDQREIAVVLQFGNPVAERTEPGIYLKMPLIQQVHKLPSTRQFWGNDPNPKYILSDLPTKDDKKIEVIPWAIWRINEPTVFVQRLRTMENAQERVAQFTRGAIRDVVTQYDLAELVRSSDRPLFTSAGQVGGNNDEPIAETVAEPVQGRRVRMNIQHGRLKILDKIKQECRDRLASGSGNGAEAGGRGIELIDVGISQIDFVASVRTKTFDRWVAERQAISARNVNEGERMKQEILNAAAAEAEKITGLGKKQANEVRGEVDAEIIKEYAKAITQVGEFYTFVRTLEAYETAITKDARLILTTDSEFFGLLKKLGND